MVTGTTHQTKTGEPPVIKGKINISAISKTKGFTPRVKASKERYMKEISKVSSDRCWYMMESYKQTEGEHEAIRRAKALAAAWDNMSIKIFDHDLIIGNWTDAVRGAHPRIEDYPEEMRNLLETNEAAWTNSQNVEASLSKQDFVRLLESAKYWQEHFPNAEQKERWDKLFDEIDPDDLQREFMYTGITITPYRTPKGERLKQRWPHIPRLQATGADYEKILRVGYRGFIKEAEDHIQRIKEGARGRDLLHEEKEMLAFLDAVVISLEGMIRHAKRFASLAREMAEKEQDPQRKAELEKAAEICTWVPENPARTFHEALQSIWFTVLGSFMDKAYANVFLGRTDQHTFPYYMADINEGRMTRQEAAELFGCFIMKLTELESYMIPAHRAIAQGTNYENITIGGVDRHGRDASNEMSCMILHVVKDTRTHQPYISLRYNNKMAPELLNKAFECAREHGGGIPAFFNDTVNIEYMLGRGHSLGDARDYGIAGCIEAVLPQCCGYVRLHAVYFNTSKLLEITLHNGTDPRTDVKICPQTGNPRHFKTFDELKNAFKKQLDFAYKTRLDQVQKWWKSGIMNDGWYFPFISALLDGPIASGRDVTRQGTRVIIDDADWCIDRQFQDSADSLLAIKKLVFEQRKYTMDEMLTALDANFEGYEKLRADCLAQPKYGNDNDEADLLMSEFWDYTKDIILSRRDIFGRKHLIFRNGSAAAAQAGKVTGALPNGRKAGGWLADAGLSPMQGMDQKGPTAVINSATKMDFTEICGSLLNMKLCPSLLDKPSGMMKFQQLVRTFMDKGGQEIQFNILDKDTLLDAQKHPQDHRDLVVRVAGYSAFWVDLEKQVQDEIIRRTEHEM